MSKPASKTRMTISQVAAHHGWKYQVARDRVLEGTFGPAEQDENGRWTVERAKVVAYKQPSKAKA